MTLTLMSAKNASLVIRGEHWRLALAAHRGGAIDENINAAELAEHWAAAAFETGIIAGISDPALHPLVLARFPQRQFERAPIACHQGHIHPLLCKLTGNSPANAAVAAPPAGSWSMVGHVGQTTGSLLYFAVCTRRHARHEFAGHGTEAREENPDLLSGIFTIC
jgi:hypothetical protein